MDKELHFGTLRLHVGQKTADSVKNSRGVPIYATTSYVFYNPKLAADRFGLRDAGNIYGRPTNSTQDVFEKHIAALEGGVAALALASEAAAITYTIQVLAQAGRAAFWRQPENLQLLANVVDVNSLVIHPATTTHSELLGQGIFVNTIRLSIGTEHIEDIIADLGRRLIKFEILFWKFRFVKENNFPLSLYE